MLEAALEVAKSPGLATGLGRTGGHGWKGTGTMELMRLDLGFCTRMAPS